MTKQLIKPFITPGETSFTYETIFPLCMIKTNLLFLTLALFLFVRVNFVVVVVVVEFH